MLRVILNRLKPQTEEIIAEERLGSEPEEAPQNRSSTLESCVNIISNISRICTMSSLISLIEHAMQLLWIWPLYLPPIGGPLLWIWPLYLHFNKKSDDDDDDDDATLWATMWEYNISANLVCTTEQLYDKATSAVQMNGSMEEWFRTTIRLRQGCLLSPTLFNIFVKRIMSDALEEHDGKVSIGNTVIIQVCYYMNYKVA